jgi:hypothetical protein
VIDITGRKDGFGKCTKEEENGKVKEGRRLVEMKQGDAEVEGGVEQKKMVEEEGAVEQAREGKEAPVEQEGGVK